MLHCGRVFTARSSRRAHLPRFKLLCHVRVAVGAARGPQSAAGAPRFEPRCLRLHLSPRLHTLIEQSLDRRLACSRHPVALPPPLARRRHSVTAGSRLRAKMGGLLGFNFDLKDQASAGELKDWQHGLLTKPGRGQPAPRCALQRCSTLRAAPPDNTRDPSSSPFPQLVFYGSYHNNRWNQLIHLLFVPAIWWTALGKRRCGLPGRCSQLVLLWATPAGPRRPAPQPPF